MSVLWRDHHQRIAALRVGPSMFVVVDCHETGRSDEGDTISIHSEPRAAEHAARRIAADMHRADGDEVRAEKCMRGVPP